MPVTFNTAFYSVEMTFANKTKTTPKVHGGLGLCYLDLDTRTYKSISDNLTEVSLDYTNDTNIALFPSQSARRGQIISDFVSSIKQYESVQNLLFLFYKYLSDTSDNIEEGWFWASFKD